MAGFGFALDTRTVTSVAAIRIRLFSPRQRPSLGSLIATFRYMADDVATPSASLFEALAESAPDAIVTIDADSTILSANQAVRRVFGYEPDDLIGERLTVLIPAHLRERHEAGMSRYLRTGEKRIPWTGVRLEGLRQSGEHIPIEISFGEFIDASGRRVFSGFIRDVTEQVRQQQALESAREDLQLQTKLLAAVEQAVISTSPDGTVLTWNHHAEQVYGYPADRAVGRNLRDLLDPMREFEDADPPIKRLRAGERTTYQRRVRRGDGTMIWVSVVAAPMFDDTGNVTRMVGTSVDITERHQLEEQLRQAQKMDAVGRLAGGVAHDFNNLLTVILANSELAATAVPPGSEVAADIAEITRAATRGAALSRQLLVFSRSDTPAARPVDLNVVVAELATMLRRLIGADIDMRLELGSDVPSIAHDVGQLEQVITNLVVNARDAMPAGGALTISTRKLHLDAPRSVAAGNAMPGLYAGVVVRDTGHGMSEGTRKRIFEPFFSTKAPTKGTGLGLATVYGIVTQSRGFIEVHSTIEVGSEFAVYLPAEEASAAQD